MIIMRVQKLNSQAVVPTYAHPGDSGMDLSALLPQNMLLEPGETVLVPTGIAIQVPQGFEGQVRSRSGLACKSGICVVNSPGTIDSGYTGEVKVGIINVGKQPFLIENGMKIAQLVLCPVEHAMVRVVDSFNETKRGANGFGSTGVK